MHTHTLTHSGVSAILKARERGFADGCVPEQELRMLKVWPREKAGLPKSLPAEISLLDIGSEPVDLFLWRIADQYDDGVSSRGASEL